MSYEEALKRINNALRTKSRHLDLSDLALDRVPDELAQLRDLTYLDLRHNKLTGLPSVVLELTGLEDLELSDNLLTDLPTGLGKLRRIGILDLSENILTCVPESISELRELRVLMCTANQLSAIPEWLSGMATLTNLFLDDNALETLPANLGHFQSLQQLSLSHNRLAVLPHSIGSLGQLNNLTLRHNVLVELPDSISELTDLLDLYINDNLIASLPGGFTRLAKLQDLDLHGNPLPAELLAAAEKGVENLFAYLHQLSASSAPLNEVKLVIIGEADVGKTTLLEALLNKPPVKNHASTEALDIERAPIPLECKETGASIRCNAWDFGGQKIYRVQHQFFFSKNAVYLLVWDPRSGPVKCDVEGWLERVKLRVGAEARILIVSTYASVKTHPPRINAKQLKEKYGDLIVGFYAVDGMEYRAGGEMSRLMQELKEAIAAAAAPTASRLFPTLWGAIRAEIAELRGDRPHIFFSEFVEICRKHKLTDVDVKTLAAIMNEVGDFVYFENAVLDASAFDASQAADGGNIIVLKPEWLAKAIGYVLEDTGMAARSDGVLEHSELRRIWYADRVEPYRYAPDLHRYFLWLMEEFYISYRLSPDKRSLVPQLITEVRPDEIPYSPGDAAPAGEREVNLVCEMTQSPPPGMMPQMIVASHQYRYQRKFPQDRNWHDGAFLNGGDLGTALMELRDRELWLTVRAGYPAAFLKQLQATLEARINKIWPGLDYRFSVPCPNCIQIGTSRGRFGLKALQEALADGRAEYPCQYCGTLEPIKPLLMGVDPTAVEMMRLLEELRAAQKSTIEIAIDLYMNLLSAIGSESKNAPCMFSIFRYDHSMAMDKYQLTLWCEHPLKPHPCCRIGTGGDGEYTFLRSKEWYQRVLPYLGAISKVLRAAVPAAAAATDLYWGANALTKVKAELDLVEKEAAIATGTSVSRLAFPELGRGAIRGESSSLRAIHDVLINELVDKGGRKWGGLTVRPRKNGDYIWLCEEHARIYDPGLPDLS